MSEYNALSSYLQALVADRETLNRVDIDAIVEERISDMRARVRAEVISDNERAKHDADVRIEAVTTALSIIASVQPDAEDEDTVSEVISDETY